MRRRRAMERNVWTQRTAPFGSRPVVTLLSLYIRTNRISQWVCRRLPIEYCSRLTEYCLTYAGQNFSTWQHRPRHCTRQSSDARSICGLRRSSGGDAEANLRKVIHYLAEFRNFALDGDLMNGADHYSAGHRIEAVVVGGDRYASAGLKTVRVARINFLGSGGSAVFGNLQRPRRDPDRPSPRRSPIASTRSNHRIRLRKLLRDARTQLGSDCRNHTGWYSRPRRRG